MQPLVAAPATAAPLPPPPFALTPKYALKWTGALVCFGAGMHYLASGRKEADMGRIMTGALLTLASLAFLV